ncbi:MAG: DUF448 domain-containing protein [Desulfocapsa sp.]|nr:DUF448 domain-containing protein [Desulfocapsa sp.]
MLQRYVWDDETETVALDRTQTFVGRGTYCCKKEKCEKQFLTRKKSWKRFFRLK